MDRDYPFLALLGGGALTLAGYASPLSSPVAGVGAVVVIGGVLAAIVRTFLRPV